MKTLLATIALLSVLSPQASELERCLERCNDADEEATAMLRIKSPDLTYAQVIRLIGEFDLIHLQCKKQCKVDPSHGLSSIKE